MDANKYINTYVDTTVGVLHEYLSQILQLKTQVKIANDVVAEKDATITEQDRVIGEQNKIIEEVDTELDTLKSNSSVEELSAAKAENTNLHNEKQILLGDIQNLKNMNVGLQNEKYDLLNQVQSLQNEIAALKQKASHIDSCMKTVTELKKEVLDRDAKILELEERLNPPKKAINKKKANVEEPIKVSKPVDRLPEDDF